MNIPMPHDASTWFGFVVGLVGGSLAMGALLGLIPLVLGYQIELKKIGRIAFFSCVIASFFVGVFGAVPTCLGFVIALIIRRRRDGRGTPNSSAETANDV